MNLVKSIFKNTRTRIWAIVTIVMVVLMIVVTVLTATALYDLACIAMGGKRNIGRESGFYYDIEAKDKLDAYNRGNALNEKICEEGFVLLKNESGALPLGKNARVSVFGKNSVNIVYGGTGSGGGNFRKAPTLYDSLEKASFTVNPVLRDFYEDDGLSGDGRTSNPAIENSGNSVLETGETPQSSYTAEVKASYTEYRDAAIIVFSRIGGEGFDLPRTAAGDASRHYLELDANEEALLDAVTNAGFGKVIVLLNASTTMEIGGIVANDKVDAVMSVGGPGYSGINALGRLLSGDVSPSGRTVDTWAADFTASPVYVNFGDNGVPAGDGTPDGAAYVRDGKETGYYYVDYEEGVYVGYRYYETRGTTDGEEWYDDNVVCPFGYGLGYTDFSWKVTNASALSGLTVADATKKDKITVSVEVTNTGGKYSGRDVVQLYCALPEGDLEKPSEVLVGFAKTGELAPGGSETVDIVFDPYYAASYDESAECYKLESGTYSLMLRTDAHTDKSGTQAVNIEVVADVVYDTDPVTGGEIENRFDGADAELDTVLSRGDWEGTKPTPSVSRELSAETEEALKSKETNNPQTEYDMPTVGTGEPFNAVTLRGAKYDDERWDDLIDCLSFDELKNLYNRGAFKTIGIMKINLPETVASDGPVGFTNFISDANVSGNVSYASQYVLGCTWSEELAEAMGESVGEEAAYGDAKAIPTPYTGWYAPGMNLHRSPFGGRNFEYYSEDPYLTGMLAAAEIRGVQSKGVIPYMKHFALNEQETHRDDNGVATWATEQSIRELYLRPFEIAVKVADARGVMSSFNRIGTRWTGGDWQLLTGVLRNEWGFEGAVICDFNVESYMSPKQMIYAGGDLNLTTMYYWTRPDSGDAGDVTMLRRAAHNVLYAVVNSNAMNGIDENTRLRLAIPLWQEILIICECAIFVGLAVWGFFEIRRMIVRQRRQDRPSAQTKPDGGKR